MKKTNTQILIDGESKEQIIFVQWMRRVHPEILIFAIPNGGARQKSQGAVLKAEGTLAGVPDLCIPGLALYIEMKTATGRVSEAQNAVIARLQAVGYAVEVCRSADEAKRVIQGRLSQPQAFTIGINRI